MVEWDDCLLHGLLHRHLVMITAFDSCAMNMVSCGVTSLDYVCMQYFTVLQLLQLQDSERSFPGNWEEASLRVVRMISIQSRHSAECVTVIDNITCK